MTMKKKFGIGMLLFTIFLANMAAPTSAYSYSGYKWQSGSAYYAIDSTVPSSWSTAISNAKNAWNNAGSSFRFYAGSGNSKLYYAGLDTRYVALTWPHGSGGQLTYCETFFNNNLAWSTSGAPGYFDVQNVATHELGHWLDLLDLYGSGDTEATMYYQIEPGELKKRSLNSDDIAGIRSIYP